MKGHDRVIDLLNEVLTNELTAINQYFLHARLCDHWGYERLWKKIRAESIDEMKHADRLIERILYLDGLPNLQRLGKINIGQNVHEMLRLDLEVEKSSIKMCNDGIEVCRSLSDNGSRELLEGILVDSEKHANWLETQLELIKQLGEAHYQAQHIHED
jgi:bacterioferritin